MKKINKVLEDTLKVIEERQQGISYSYKTGFSKLDKVLGGGIPFRTNFTIGGRTSTGKSAFANILLLNILAHNKDIDFKVIYWNWEMSDYQQGLRIFSNTAEKSVQQLMSAEEKIPDEVIKSLRETKKKLESYEVYFVENPCNPDGIWKEISKLAIKGVFPRIINVFDHTRLTLKKERQSNEEEKIHALFETCQTLKKHCNSTNIILSQLNRNIENYIVNNGYREPSASDLFGADAVAQYSEVICLLHRPELYDQKNLPRSIDSQIVPAKDKLVAEIVKNRDGPISTLIFEHNLQINQVKEWTLPQKTQLFP